MEFYKRDLRDSLENIKSDVFKLVYDLIHFRKRIKECKEYEKGLKKIEVEELIFTGLYKSSDAIQDIIQGRIEVDEMSPEEEAEVWNTNEILFDKINLWRECM